MEDRIKNEFIELYEPVHSQFCRYCRTIAGNAEDAEDLIQDTVLNVLVSFDKIRDKSAFKSFLFGVAGNLNKMKHRRRKVNLEFSAEESNHILHYAQDQEFLTDFSIIYEKILLLPQRMAETIMLFHISDLSLDEIQQIQGGSLSGVKLRLKRGREKLLALLNTPEQVKMAHLILMF